MMRMTMKPQKAQFSPNTPNNDVIFTRTNPGSSTFNKAIYLMFGYTKFTALAVGAGGGRSGVVNVSGNTTKDGNFHFIMGASGGGGGGSQTKTGNLMDLALNTSIVVGATGAPGSDRTTYGTAGNGGRGGYSAFGSIARASGGSGGGGGKATRYHNLTNAYRGAGGIGNSTSGTLQGNGGGWSGPWNNGVGNGGAGGYPGRRAFTFKGDIYESDRDSTPGSPGAAGIYAASPEPINSRWNAGGGGGLTINYAAWLNLNRLTRGTGWQSPGSSSRGFVALLIE